MTLKFNIIIFAKDIEPPFKNFFTFGFTLAGNGARNFGYQATTESIHGCGGSTCGDTATATAGEVTPA